MLIQSKARGEKKYVTKQMWAWLKEIGQAKNWKVINKEEFAGIQNTEPPIEVVQILSENKKTKKVNKKPKKTTNV